MAAERRYALRMDHDADLQKKAECGGAVTALSKYALESKIVDAVLAVTEGADLYDAVPALITDPKDLDKTAGSLHCGTLLLPKLVKKYLDGRQEHEDRGHGQGLRHDGHLRAGQAQARSTSTTSS